MDSTQNAFTLKTKLDTDKVEMLMSLELTNDFKQNICMPYFKDIYKVILY